MNPEDIRLEALKLAIQYSPHETDTARVLSIAERFAGFLATGEDKPLLQRISEAMESARAS